MSGEIGVESAKGQGSRFWFTAEFGLCDINEKEERREQELNKLLSNKKLLLVGVKPKMSEFLSLHCQSWGCSVQMAVSAKVAVANIVQAKNSGESFDFIGVESVLSDMSGLDFLRLLRSREEEKSTPVFVMSAGELVLDRQTLNQFFVKLVLRKPLSGKTLKYGLAGLLGHESPAPTATEVVNLQPDRYMHLRVLVAEDNAVNRIVIKGLLGKIKIQPELAENGAIAFDMVRKAETLYDIILMDCEMPEMDGFEATRSIREFEATRNLSATPIVALTAHALQEHRDAVFAAGMNHYLSKPVTLNNLTSVFDRILQDKSRH
jgi:CheY-like chemotaxis protein